MFRLILSLFLLNIFIFHSLLPQSLTILFFLNFIWICACFDIKCFWTYIKDFYFIFIFILFFCKWPKFLDYERFSSKVFFVKQSMKPFLTSWLPCPPLGKTVCLIIFFHFYFLWICLFFKILQMCLVKLFLIVDEMWFLKWRNEKGELG